MHFILHELFAVLCLSSCSLCPSDKSLVWFPFPLRDRSPLQVRLFNEAWRSPVLSTRSVFSESTKYIFVSLVSIKGKNPPVLPSEKFFWSDCSQNESWGEIFFCQLGCLIYLVPLMKTKLRVERLHSWGKKKRRRRCFSSFCDSEAKIWPFIFLVIAENTW